MTRDKVMSLSDDELRIAVAKARGYTIRQLHGNYLLYDPNGNVVFMAAERSEEAAWLHSPDYPRDIAAAWPLIEEIGPSTLRRTRTSRSQVRWRLYWYGGTQEPDFTVDVSGESDAQTICRAYLVAKEMCI